MTGVDMARAVRGRYKTARGAYSVLRKSCGGGLREFADFTAERFGKKPVPPLLAQRGDVMLLRLSDGPRGEVLGICAGKYVFAASLAGGVYPVPVSMAVKAWRI